MISRRSLLTACAAVAACAAALGSPTRADEVVRIATEGAYPPYSFIGAKGTPRGFEIDLGDAICARLDLTCTWIVVPWEDLREGLEAGDYDVIMAAMSNTAERREWADFGRDYFGNQSETRGMFVGKSTFQEPQNGTVAVQVGTIYETWLRANGYRVITYPTAGAALKAVLDGEASTTMGSPTHLEPRVYRNGRVLTIIGTVAMDVGGAAAAFAKGSALRDKFNAEMEQMRADGSLAKISGKWFGSKEL